MCNCSSNILLCFARVELQSRPHRRNDVCVVPHEASQLPNKLVLAIVEVEADWAVGRAQGLGRVAFQQLLSLLHNLQHAHTHGKAHKRTSTHKHAHTRTYTHTRTHAHT